MSKEYVQIAFNFDNQDQFELLVAQLSNIGFDGFNEEEAATGINNGVGMSSVLGSTAGLGAGSGHCKTFILSTEFEAQNFNNELDIIIKQYNLTYSKSIVKEENWNAIWESNFEPVRIDDFVGIRAHFHPHFEPEVEYEINITPKMSFGTGHHATTRMMMKAMLEMNFNNKTVIDFGTGTGILAILAEKLLSTQIEAIDNDSWSVTNVEENIAANNCTRISIQLGTNLDCLGEADVMLANINKSVLLEHVSSIRKHLKPNGSLLISGLLAVDYDDIIEKYTPIFGTKHEVFHDSGWIAILF